MINIDQFKEVEMKVGTILQVEDVEGSEKLYKLTVDLGEDSPRTVLSGIKKWFNPEDLINTQAVFVANLEPRPMMGLESQGMIMAVGDENPVLLRPATPVSPGSKVR